MLGVGRVGLIAVLLGWCGSVAAAPVTAPHVSVELVADVTAIAPGRAFRLGVHFVPEREWHVYWKNPGDSGEAPRLTWTLPAGLAAGAIEWPAPVRLTTGTVESFGYPGDVLLGAPVTVTDGIASGATAEIGVLAKWLVCNADECIPGSAALTLSLPLADAPRASLGDAPRASGSAWLFVATRARLPRALPASWHLTAGADAADLFVVIQPPAVDPKATPYLFVDDQQAFEPSSQGWSRDAQRLYLTLPRRSGAHMPDTLAGVLRVGDAAYTIATPIGPVESGTSDVAPTGLAVASGFAFLGGLLLNLMPCVFPVLAVKAFALAGLGGEARRRVRRHGLVYAFGVVASFWVLAGLLIAARAGGAELGWGFQFQHPVMIALLAGLFFWMALLLLDVVSVGSSIMGVGQHLTVGESDRAAFFTGVLATVVATPCTAPFMGTAIGYALAQPAQVAFAVFTSLGLGLAFPYVLVTFVPALAARLPRPGAWMETLKQLLAFPLLATVVWLVWVASIQAGPPAVVAILAGLVSLAFAAWVAGRWRSGIGRAVATVAVGVAIAFGATIAPLDRGARAPASHGAAGAAFEWEPFSTLRVAELRAQGRPVFVDFTAAWCVTCQVNKKVALETREVTAKMQELGVVAMRADWTNPDAEIARTLQEFGRDGVPLYVLYRGADEPRILPQILTPTIVISELEQLKGRSST